MESLLSNLVPVLTQFLACLTLTVVPIWVRDNLQYYTDNQVVDQIFNMSGLFNDPLHVAIFLLAPYIFMVSLDIYTRKQRLIGNRSMSGSLWRRGTNLLPSRSIRSRSGSQTAA